MISKTAEIGTISAPKEPPTPWKHRSPAYYRRLARRQANRQTVDENSSVEAGEASSVVDGILDNEAVKPVMVDNDAPLRAESSHVLEDAEQACLNSNVDYAEIEGIDEVIVYAVPPSDIRKSMQNANEVETEVKEKFSSLGVEVKDMKIKSNKQGKFESSLVKISPPVNLNRIWGRRLGLTYCAVVEFKETDRK